MPSSNRMHLAVHKVNEVLLTPELFRMENDSRDIHKALILG